MITILAVGKKHESWIEEGILRYQTRLRSPWNVKWQLLAHSRYDGNKARDEESEAIMQKVSQSDYLVLLDERGQELDSPSLSKLLSEQFSKASKIVVLIGGAYGVNSAVRKRADMVISLSALVFPHQLVRLILLEQVYRAQQISHGGAYHHN